MIGMLVHTKVEGKNLESVTEMEFYHKDSICYLDILKFKDSDDGSKMIPTRSMKLRAVAFKTSHVAQIALQIEQNETETVPFLNPKESE